MRRRKLLGGLLIVSPLSRLFAAVILYWRLYRGAAARPKIALSALGLLVLVGCVSIPHRGGIRKTIECFERREELATASKVEQFRACGHIKGMDQYQRMAK